MAASTTYKRLAGRAAGEPASPDASPVVSDSDDDAQRKGQASHRRPRSRLVLALLICAAAALVLTRSLLAASLKAHVGEPADAAAEGALGAALGAVPAAAQIAATNPVGAADDDDAEADAASLKDDLNADAARLRQTDQEDAAQAGPQDGAPQQILVEANDSERPADLSGVDVNWDEMLAEAPTRRLQVLKEWGIDMDTQFFTLDEFKDIIGFQCPSLRHCSVKHNANLFFGGGSWEHAEDGQPFFEPHNCWMYNFDGNELWTRNNQATQRVVVFIDGDASRSVFAEAAQMSESFHYLSAERPTNLQEEMAVREELTKTLDTYSHAPDVAVTLVVNWISPDKEQGLVKLLQRIGGHLRVSSLSVVWTAMPYYSNDDVDLAVKTNEAMAASIKKTVRENQGALLTKRMPLKLWMRGNGNGPNNGGPNNGNMNNNNKNDGPRMLITFKEFAADPSSFAIFDVRMDTRPLEASHLDYFNRYGSKLPLVRLQNGWTPNLNTDTKIIVYCQSGMNANKAVRLLRMHGYKNARAMALQSVKPMDMSADLAPPMHIRNDVSLRGLDLFAPSLGLPEDMITPQGAAAGSSQQLVQFTANAILNLAYRTAIVGSASSDANHVCYSQSACTTCFAVVGSVPSGRLTFEVLKTYLPNRSVPTKIALSKEHRIWDGDWISFLKHNENTQLTVRKNYSTVRTRRFEKQPLPEYLQQANIVRKADSGDFEETGEAPQTGPDALPVYAGNNKLDKNSMAEYDFKYPEWIRRNSFQRPAMWLGPKGSLSSLHVDHTNRGNLAYQVLGRKRWHLFPPRNGPFMYGKKVGVVVWSSLIDPSTYDGERVAELPLFKLGLPESIDINVEAGEMLYNPDGWWHVVYNTEASLMLNFWLKASVPVLPPSATENSGNGQQRANQGQQQRANLRQSPRQN